MCLLAEPPHRTRVYDVRIRIDSDGLRRRGTEVGITHVSKHFSIILFVIRDRFRSRILNGVSFLFYNILPRDIAFYCNGNVKTSEFRSAYIIRLTTTTAH